jgi:hypothetical protein
LHLGTQTSLQAQHFDFLKELAACTYNLPSPNYPIRPLFYKIVKNIQLHKQILHCCVFYHGVAMIEWKKIGFFFFLLTYIALWVTCYKIIIKMLSKIQLFIGNMNVFSQEIMLQIFYFKHGYQSLVTTLMFP